ncbi:MAG: hypothetical protein PVG39_32160 [Desulfobacteraceae bacterium]|jgi:hypothetical protein
MAIIIGIVALPCWLIFWISLLFDMYLIYPEYNIPVKSIAVAAFLLNIAGIILEIIELKKKKKWLTRTHLIKENIIEDFIL